MHQLDRADKKWIAMMFVVFIVVSAITKFPFILALLFALFMAIRDPKHKALPKKVKPVIHEGEVKFVAAPKKRILEGVGQIEWITDPRQLEHGRAWNSQQIASAEASLLYCDPREWLLEGEKRALREAEPKNEIMLEYILQTLVPDKPQPNPDDTTYNLEMDGQIIGSYSKGGIVVEGDGVEIVSCKRPRVSYGGGVK